MTSFQMHRTIEPLDAETDDCPGYTDFRLWLAAKTVLLGAGLVKPSDCCGAASLPFLLERLESLPNKQFLDATRHLERMNESVHDIQHMKYILQRWYCRESKHKYDYNITRHLKPPPVKTPCASRERAAKQLTIPQPANGAHYRKEEAIAIITRYPNGSCERGRVRQMMIAKGYMSSRSTLCRHVKRYEDGETPEAARKRTIDPKKVGLGYEGDYIRPNIRHAVKWEGRIVLPMIPVSLLEIATMQHAPATSRIANIDICAFIGNSDVVSKSEHGQSGNAQDDTMGTDRNFNVFHEPNFPRLCKAKRLPALKFDWERRRAKGGSTMRIARLYFSPVEYPPPPDGKRDNIVCGHLRNRIETTAEAGHSPVVCVGSSETEKRFRCKRWYRRDGTPDLEKLYGWRPYNIHSCTFSFVMKWDQYGYYIPLLEDKHGEHNMGCAWHCCPENKSKK